MPNTAGVRLARGSRVCETPGSAAATEMTVRRMDNVGILVEDLPQALAFYRDLGLDLEGQATIEGAWLGRVTGVRAQRPSAVACPWYVTTGRPDWRNSWCTGRL